MDVQNSGSLGSAGDWNTVTRPPESARPWTRKRQSGPGAQVSVRPRVKVVVVVVVVVVAVVVVVVAEVAVVGSR